MKTQIDKKQVFLLGILLFSMFFGSGNLIFPPFLGYQAGNQTFISLVGFSITAIIFPILAVIVIAKSKDLMTLSGRVSQRFAIIFSIIVFLALGPGLAIPRNAAVSFEMAVTPFVSEINIYLRICYALIFFSISFMLSIKPESLVDWLGKILGPILIVMMIALCVGCFLSSDLDLKNPILNYEDHQFMQGFLDGYNTMDTLAALNFGNIIALNVMNKGIKEEKTVMRYVIHAGWIAGIFLFIIYGILAYVGALSSVNGATNGAYVLTTVMQQVFGTPGVIILAMIYVLSCLTTCVGLLCSCGEYFASISKISYKVWIILFSIAGFIFSIIGLDQLLQISVPFLVGIYPIAMVLVILSLFHKYIEKFTYIYKDTMVIVVMVSIVYGLSSAGIEIPILTNVVLHHFFISDLCWIIPSIIGICIGYVHSRIIIS